MSKAVGENEVDEKLLEEVYSRTGVTGKVQKAKCINEIKGIGVAAAIGKTASSSFVILMISILAQSIWGGPAGWIASISIGVISIGITLGSIQYDKITARKIAYYSVELCCTTFEKISGAAESWNRGACV